MVEEEKADSDQVLVQVKGGVSEPKYCQNKSAMGNQRAMEG